jgi:DNA mismatch repair protein MutS2
LERLALVGSVLEPRELFALGSLLTSSRVLKESLRQASEKLPALSSFLLEDLYQDRATEKTIIRVVDREGEILDSASKELRRLRGRLRQAHGKIVRALEGLLGSLPERFVVSDASVTIREGRYVIPIRREGRGEVGGTVLDESASGATLFVEPPVASGLMSELRTLQREEHREILRILREQTEGLRPVSLLLEAAQEALVAFDSIFARAQAARAWEGAAPALLPPGTQELEVVFGRHPLLLAKDPQGVVPFHLRLDSGERALVVSGPNTGGKSVLLKAMGLISMLSQSGIVPPVGPGTRIPLFTRIFADIGDEQSIVESLSTFSAHLGNLKDIVQQADGESLVLIDEMGTGTDPQEGAALAKAVLQELVKRGTLTVATSHLGALKQLDTPGSGVVNASLQFDPDRIEPTYHLLKGRPGRSYGLAIARRLGFPGEILDRAEEHLPQEEARMEDLLATLESKEREAAQLVQSLATEREEAERLKEGLLEREAALKERERSARARAQEEARRLLMDARKEVEEAIQEVRAAGARSRGEGDALDEAQRRARRRVEEAAGQLRSGKGGSIRPEGTGDAGPGDRVRVGETGSKGIVVEVRDGRALVETSGLRMQVPLEELAVLGDAQGNESKRPSSAAVSASSWQGPEAEPDPEIDLRGLRVADLRVEVDRAIDQAVLGGLGELRIIHGKGTGALRAAVSEILAADGRVSDFRMGGPGEGGAGVTVVRLR